MAFPNTQISTANLDSDADSPSLARVDLYNAVTALNTIIADANSADGVCVLNAGGTIASNQIPLTVSPTGTLVLAPTTGVVKIQDVLRMQTLTTAEVEALTGTTGDIVYTTDGDAGQPCLAAYDGSKWRVVRFMTSISSAAISISVTASISCDLTEVV